MLITPFTIVERHEIEELAALRSRRAEFAS
jgi:hypothetical protein